MVVRDEDVSATHGVGIRSAIISVSPYDDGVIYCMQILVCKTLLVSSLV